MKLWVNEDRTVLVREYDGCTSDEFYTETTPNIDSLLSRLGIEVEDAA